MMYVRVIQLLGTEGCHLCEEAWWLLAPLSEPYQWHIEQLDISEQDDADQLIERYGLRLPVLRYQQHELDWPFTVEQVQCWLDKVDVDSGRQ